MANTLGSFIPHALVNTQRWALWFFAPRKGCVAHITAVLILIFLAGGLGDQGPSCSTMLLQFDRNDSINLVQFSS